MKAFDFEKHPEIDSATWDRNGKCRGFYLEYDSIEWIPSRKSLPDYDIDPNTEGFDWTKSKQVRPTTKKEYLSDGYDSAIQENYKLKERIAELEKDLTVEKAFYQQCNLTKDAYHERILELEKISAPYVFGGECYQGQEVYDYVKDLNGLVYLLEKDLDAKYSKKEKLIDFFRSRLEWYLNGGKDGIFHSNEDAIELANKETVILEEAIVRIENKSLKEENDSFPKLNKQKKGGSHAIHSTTEVEP